MSDAGLDISSENNSIMEGIDLEESLAMLKDDEQHREILEQKGEAAQRWLDILQLVSLWTMPMFCTMSKATNS